MDFRKHVEIAWKLTLEHIVPLLIMTLVMLILYCTVILIPVVTAGYTHSILLMLRQGREPKVQDLFSQMGLFLPLLGFGIVVFVLTAIGTLLLVLPGLLFSLFVSYTCVYMLPLMTDKKMGVVDAVKESMAIALDREHMLDHLITVIIYMAAISIGGAFFIGAVFTMPLATIFLMSTYEERIKGR